jgi:ubiquinone/menaquinone biosynthesis C-methylase UbiE
MSPLPSEIYDRKYFLSDCCEGWEDFRADRGLSSLKARQFDMLKLAPGMRVLDAGCGRGQMLLACASAGAEVAGIDYADAAVELTRETLADVKGADIRRGDVTSLPWPDEFFDRILFGDVIEHLDPDQAEAGLHELKRVLRPGGFVLVHTAPNRLFLRVAWPISRVLLRAVGQREAADRLDAWLKEAESYHVNEQSVFTLRRSLKAVGFEDYRVWTDSEVLRGGSHHLTAELHRSRPMALAAGLAGRWPLRLVLSNDVYGVARKADAKRTGSSPSPRCP